MLAVDQRIAPAEPGPTVPDQAPVAREFRRPATGFVWIAGTAVLSLLAVYSLGETYHSVAELLGFGLFVVVSRLVLLAGLGRRGSGGPYRSRAQVPDYRGEPAVHGRGSSGARPVFGREPNVSAVIGYFTVLS